MNQRNFIRAFLVFMFVLIPFGGPIVKIIPPIPPICNFPVIIVGGPVPNAVTLTPFTIIFTWRSIKIGSWVLGLTTPIGTACPYAGGGVNLGTSP